MFLAQVATALGQRSEGSPERGEYFDGVTFGKEVDGRQVMIFQQADLQLPQKSRHGHPEVVPYHDDALQVLAVALPQGLYQFGVLFLLLGVQPLLELIQDHQHLVATTWNTVPLTQSG